VRQLFELQCLEQDIEAIEQALAKSIAAVGESRALKEVKTKLAQAVSEINATKAEQKNTEIGITNISAKIEKATESLYSGRIKNPKELQSLQQDISSLQSQRNPLEEKVLSLMEMYEKLGDKVKQLSQDLAQVEKEWLVEQHSLRSRIENDKQRLAELRQKWPSMTAAIPPADLAAYNQLKKTRGWGVARMEQGTCGRCRLNLSTSEIQRARSGQVVSCSSCGRLIYFE
jgi:predicted  nucleic acid-binding Zn-ribbon protein